MSYKLNKKKENTRIPSCQSTEKSHHKIPEFRAASTQKSHQETPEFRAANQLKNQIIKYQKSGLQINSKILNTRISSCQSTQKSNHKIPEFRAINQLKNNQVPEFRAANQLKNHVKKYQNPELPINSKIVIKNQKFEV